ncbi:hypothetical protein BGZ68_002994 [Mortierella alpina]|nr:hypothetical protein BGZ68_002994 [Mortierella alpina]
MAALAAMVAQHLSLKDIAACKLTSKVLNKAFNPYLWRRISTAKPTDKDRLAHIFNRARASGSLHRNRQYIETLDLEIFAAEYLCALLNISSVDDVVSMPSAPAQEPTGTASHPGFASLKALSITIGALNDIYSSWNVHDKAIAAEPLITLLETATNITRLTLYPEVLGNTKFIATLDSGLPHLETFILRRARGLSALYFPVSCVLPILQPLFSKPKLTTLKLDFIMSYKRTLHSALVTKAMKDLAKNPKVKSAITSMVFPTGEYDLPSTFVNPIMKSCLPQLQILNVPFIGDQAYSKFADIVRDHCPNQGVVRLIEACKNLRVFYGSSSSLGGDGGGIARALHKHAATLETLFLEDTLVSSDVVGLLETMKALRTLVVSHRGTLNVKGAISVRWAPRHLQRLELTMEVKESTLGLVKSQKLDLDPEFNPGLPSGKLEDEDLGYVAMRKFFKKLGELTELQDLYIKHSKHSEWNLDKDWTLGVGLGFLGGLIKLRKLRLDYGLQHIGQAEVEFMHKHWPNLQEVVFYGEKNHVDKYMKLWTWLKARRPYLRYTYHTYIQPREEYNPFDQFLYCNLEGY